MATDETGPIDPKLPGSWVLEQLGIEPSPPPAEPPEPREPLDHEELDRMTRKLLYSELEKLGLLDQIL